MVSRSSRLPSAEFASREYHTTKTPYFSLKTKKNGGTTARIGIVAGKAVHKSAVKRNFWRRQAKIGILAHATAATDYLLIIFPKINELTKKEFRAILTKAL
jgi:ribonuclease P protein component